MTSHNVSASHATEVPKTINYQTRNIEWEAHTSRAGQSKDLVEHLVTMSLNGRTLADQGYSHNQQ